MKSNRKLWVGAVGIGAALVAGVVMAQMAEVQVLEASPEFGTFFSLQKTNDPPLPFNPFPELPLYALGTNTYVFDDREVDYVAMQQEREALRLLWQAAAQSLASDGFSLMSLGSEPPATPGGDDGGGTNTSTYCGPPMFLSSTGLCLYPPVFTSSNLQALRLTLTLTNGVAGAPYDLFMTTNLTTNVAGLNLTNWAWLYRGLPGQTNFTVTNGPAPEAYFRLGTTNDSDHDWLTDAYEFLVSHTCPTNSDTDGDSMSDGWEVLHGFNPLASADGSDDPDGDDVTNAQEYNGGTNSTDPLDCWVVGWGLNSSGQLNVPASAGWLVAVDGGLSHSVGLRGNGTVVSWGSNGYGQTNVPTSLMNPVKIAASVKHALALRSDGTLSTWGAWSPDSYPYHSARACPAS